MKLLRLGRGGGGGDTQLFKGTIISTNKINPGLSRSGLAGDSPPGFPSWLPPRTSGRFYLKKTLEFLEDEISVLYKEKG